MSVVVVNASRTSRKRKQYLKSEVVSYLLVREAGGLGDDIRIGAVARAIKKEYPLARVTVLGLDCFRAVFEHLDGIDVFKPIDLELKYRRGRSEAIAKAKYLKPYITGYDEVVDLFCPGYNYEVGTSGKVVHERTDRFLLAAGFSINQEDLAPVWHVTEGELQDAETWLTSSINPYKPIVGVHRRSTDNSRTYKSELSMELIHRLYDAGFNVILFDVAREFGNHPAIPAIKLDIEMVAAVIKLLDVLVCVDSGLMHVAGAVGTPIVGLFGSTDPYVIAKHYDCTPVIPYGYWGELPSPCGNPCYYRTKRGWSPKCRETGCMWLNMIHPPDIIKKVREVLSRKEDVRCIMENT